MSCLISYTCNKLYFALYLEYYYRLLSKRVNKNTIVNITKNKTWKRVNVTNKCGKVYPQMMNKCKYDKIITSYCTVLDFIHECLFCFYFDEALAESK